jgi:hypothetical protein
MKKMQKTLSVFSQAFFAQRKLEQNQPENTWENAA